MERTVYSAIFAPASFAVIGASDRESAGGTIYGNLLAEYRGKLYAVNPKHKTVRGQPCYPSIADVPEAVDAVVIATAAEHVPGIVQACGRQGVKGAVVLASGPNAGQAFDRKFEENLIKIGRKSGVRILGPNCLGIMRPAIGLNAAYTNIKVRAGQIALVSQSDALASAVLDCGQGNNIGFSSVISLGAASDIDISDALDFLATDNATESIMLYLEGVHDARRFMSALAAACRAKPVVVMKAGRYASGSSDDITHSGAIVGSDEVFEAAIRRAGAVRINTLNQFFAAAKTLSSRLKPQGNRLAIVSNGNGPGIMAADRATQNGVPLASFSAQTIDKLKTILPPVCRVANPLDLLGDADAQRFVAATQAVLDDPEVDGVLTILSPLRTTKPLETAWAIIEMAQDRRKPLLTCWMGDYHVMDSRQAFIDARVPSMRTPEAGVDAFAFIADYQRNQQLLLQMPPASAASEPPSIESARLIIEAVLSEGRKILSEVESKAVLAAFRIPVVQTAIARNANEALVIAAQIGFPVAMKVHSPDITHKSEAHGVRLDIGSAQDVKSTYLDICEEVAKAQPAARVEGVAIQPMIDRSASRELHLGITRDKLFGPVVTFGAGGRLTELIRGHVVTLPPLNGFLVGRFISRSPVARLLGETSEHPALPMGPVEDAMLRVSEMACELPWIVEMDINPLLAGPDGVLALDARIVVDYAPPHAVRYSHMAIHPYPAHLVSRWQLSDGTNVVIRPIRPEDAQLEHTFVERLSDQTRYFRFLGTLKALTPGMLLRFTQYDYDRELGLAVVAHHEDKEIEIGAARYVSDQEGTGCEFAIVIADEWQKRGLGTKLMAALIDAARQKKLKRMYGEVLATNEGMLKLMESLGFSVTTNSEDPTIKLVTYDL
jgi:acetyltransferase